MKRWGSMFSTVWLGVATHKLRSFLTMLGIVIGVAAVIVLMSVGKGTTESVVSRISSLGANTLFISPSFSISQGGVRTSFGSANTLTLEDAQAIASGVNNVEIVAPSSTTNVQAVEGDQNLRASVIGVTPQYQQVYSIKMSEGSFISDSDYQSNAQVAVIGANVASTLFPDSDPVGQTVRAGNYIVNVEGVMQASGQSIAGNTDDAIIIPLTTLQLYTGAQLTPAGDHIVRSIGVMVTDAKYSTSVTNDITSLLMERHNIADGGTADFRITSVEALLSSVSSITNELTLLLGAIAAISLLVGGIGVMNIMLVSVLERTREIGIRKALGARGHDIWLQFLIEAAFLTLAGGLIGVAIGWGGAVIISKTGLFPTLVSASTIVMAVSVSVGIGIFFGFYPAWNASRLDPIQALRSE
ncbi:MAG TPA: ABC transporter permease [Dehalococcoidales bacterium]|nr:ABC transporter permease [Dehalococcoidales bacterium]